MKCDSDNVILFGTTRSGCQRYRCKCCNFTYTFHNQANKNHREKIWFVEWVLEGYSVRQLTRISRKGVWKIKQIIRYWLDQEIPELVFDGKLTKYLIFDGTYFQHENCLLLLLDSQNSNALGVRYRVRENYAVALEIFQEVKARGVNPIAITIDGHTGVIRAIKDAWPDIIMQRCLAHIQRQGLSWLRRFPKLKASKELRRIYLRIFNIDSYQERDRFYKALLEWEKRYGQEVEQLPSSHKVFGDLQRARSLLLNAWPNMFHYLNDPRIANTTNLIEGYFSGMKGRYRQHHGLSKINRQKYLEWYVNLKNNS